MTFLLFAMGLVLLVVGSNLFVDAAVRIAKRFGLSEMLIGATLVSVGTTLPELLVSATAAFQGHAEMAAGNAVGSVICNTALVAGAVQAIRPSMGDFEGFRRSYSQFFLAACAYALLVLTGGGITRFGAAALIFLFVLYTAQSCRQAKKERQPDAKDAPEGRAAGDLVLTAFSACMLFVGATLLVDNGSAIARLLLVPERVISISMIALGTSLPELLTAVTALRKRHAAIAIGNVIGANILNIVLVSGVAGLIRPMEAQPGFMDVDIPVMLLVSLLLAVPGFVGKKLYRWQGVVLLVMYALYIGYLYGAG